MKLKIDNFNKLINLIKFLKSDKVGKDNIIQ